MNRISPKTLLAIDNLFAARIRELKAPSSVWGVFNADGLVHTGCAGHLSLSNLSLPNPNTVYRIASCTKSFTAAGLLALRDAQFLQLDDPIQDYLPEIKFLGLPGMDLPAPTLRMVLTMSLGLPTDDPWADRQESMSSEAFTTLLSEGIRLESIPGTRFSYSNLGYAMLGRVIERVSGQAYPDFIQDRFLSPLGLNKSGFDLSKEIRLPDSLAVGHKRSQGKWHALKFSTPGAFSSIGGLFSTIQ